MARRGPPDTGLRTSRELVRGSNSWHSTVRRRQEAYARAEECARGDVLLACHSAFVPQRLSGAIPPQGTLNTRALMAGSRHTKAFCPPTPGISRYMVRYTSLQSHDILGLLSSTSTPLTGCPRCARLGSFLVHSIAHSRSSKGPPDATTHLWLSLVISDPVAIKPRPSPPCIRRHCPVGGRS